MADSPVKVVILTSSYPFGAGEEFLDGEAAHWPADRMDITVVPTSVTGAARRLPDGVALDAHLAHYRTRWRKVVATAFALVHVLLLREVVDLVRHRALTAPRLVSSVLVVGQTLLIRRGLEQMLAGVDDVAVYTYWHSSGTYAAVLLKRSGRLRVVVSRGHGSDVYEAITPARWHPLKRQMIAEVDHTWAVSADGARELVERYGAPAARVSVSRLGVVVPKDVAPAPMPAPEPFEVLSLSSCIALKQLPLIARSLAEVALAHPESRIRWSHVGDGPELEPLRELAEEFCAAYANLTVWLPGRLAHDAVIEMLGTRGFDVLVNASRSEGVPVSIMEAMSYGVPTVAPDVGGVSELVGPDDGWLLPSVVHTDDLVRALEAALADRGAPERRAAARSRVVERFDGAVNYTEFTEDLVRIVCAAQG